MPNSQQQRPAPTPSDWADLVELQSEQASRIRIIETGHSHLIQQMAEITVTLHAQDRRIEENAKQLAAISEGVQRTTQMGAEQLAMLQDVKEAVITAHALRRLAKGLAGLIITGAAMWLALKDLLGVKTP